MIVGYCRVSTFEPAAGLAAQRRDLAAIGAQQFFCEKGNNFRNMPELERAIAFARKGDVIAVTKSYRVARSTRGVLALIDRLGRKGIGFRILNTPIDTSTTTGRMILGSTPAWSLGISPLQSVLRDLTLGWRHARAMRVLVITSIAFGGLFVFVGTSGLSRSEPNAIVAFDVPDGACDTHIHVIGNPAEFPMSPERDYTPPPATAAQLIDVLKFLHVSRGVIVTPTIYGNDNSATVAAVKQLGRERARGVAMVDDSVPAGTLDAMKDEGITGIRLLLSRSGTLQSKHLMSRIELAKELGWHVQISTPPDVVAALAPELAASPVPLVLDYFGWIAGGVDQPGFDAVLSLLKSGRVYVKLSEPYRLSKKAPDYNDLAPVVQALVAANPDRVLWGSGWPHVDSSGAVGRTKIAANLPVDTGHLLNLLAIWVPDVETRRKILVDNPARLYGF